jgi:integrase
MMKMKRPKYVKGFIDRNGHSRFYFRRVGFKPVPLPGLPWSPTFMAAYEAAMTGQPAQMIPASKAKAGSFAALAQSYFASPGYKALKPATRRLYNNAIERWCKTKDNNGNEGGTLSAATLQPHHVDDMMKAKADKPESANLVRKVLRALMQHAVKIRMRPDDPTRDIKKLRANNTLGFHSWTDSEIEQFEICHPIGTKPRLAHGLLLYLGQRRSDIVGLGRQHIDENGAINVRQIKTDAILTIPMHSALRAIIDATPSEHLTFLTTQFGKPFTVAGFGKWFRKHCDDAGLPHCSAHGLRKAAARRLAEAGCTAHEIAAITGHASLREVERYTKAAEQKRLAMSAMNKTEPPTVKPERRVDQRRKKQ